MPTRLLRDWTDSDAFDGLSADAERLFVRLLMKADDYGRFHAEPRRLKSALFPLSETLRTNDLVRWRDELAHRQLILCYETGNRQLLTINRFRQRLKNSVPKFPPPDGKPEDWLMDSGPVPPLPGSSGKSPEHPARDGDVFGDGDEVGKKTSSAGADPIPFEEIVAAYHEHLSGLPRVAKLSDKRRRMVKARWAEDAECRSVAYWADYFAYAAKSDFLTGRDGRWTGCDFEWLMNASNHLKVIEGKYHRGAWAGV